MKFLKRIAYGVIVGTCIMMINHKCVKAYTINEDYNTNFFKPVGSVSSDSYSYYYNSALQQFYYVCSSGQSCVDVDAAGYTIQPSITFDNNQWSFAGWDVLEQNNTTNSSTAYHSILSGSTNKKVKAFGSLLNPVPNNSEQTSTFIRVDTQNLPFNVNNWGVFCGNGSFCIGFFSEGDLPSVYVSSGSSATTSNMNINIVSRTVIVAFRNYEKNQYQPTRYYYVFYDSNIGDVFTGFDIGYVFYSYYNYGSDNSINYISTQDMYINTDLDYTLTANAPLEQTFDIEYTEIASTDNSDELYGNDNTVTSTNIGARFIPYDSLQYDYYLTFTNDSSCPNNIADYNKMEDSDEGIMVLANITENGLVCGAITRKNNNNIIFSKSYTIDKVGKLSTFGFSNNKFSIFIDNLVNKLNYGGPISSLLTIPLSLLSAIINAFNSSCSSYNLGQVLGHNITFSCVTLNSILGSSITGVIDIFGSFTIYYHLVLFVISIYRKIMNLEDLDDYIPQQSKSISYDDLYW